MDGEATALNRLDRLIWAMVAAVALIVLAAPLVSDFRIEWRAFAAPALACAALLAAGWFYRHWRTDPRLASGLTSTAQVIAFAAVGAPLSYLAASAGFPLQDHAFDAIDRALGFDWQGMLSWMNGAPMIYAVLSPIYLSLTLQMTIAVLCLAFSGRLLWLRVYTLAFIFAALICIAVSVVLPAAGAWPYLGLTAADSPHVTPAVSTSWPVFYGLRDGTFRALVAVGSEGIITFPSLHAALAVILIAALWPIAILRWVILGLNSLMLIGTPIDGSHYLIDVLAGVALAVLCLLAARALAAASQRTTAILPARELASPRRREVSAAPQGRMIFRR
jgi:membrane-associated phospholipid phosphatase